MVDRLEKLGRFLLWLSLAALFAMVPIGVSGMLSARAADRDAEQRAAEREAAAKRKELDAPPRLSFKTMGSYIRALEGNQGDVWFTNVSPRSGVVCIKGVATNSKDGKTSESMASCQHVEPYASRVHMQLQFGGDVVGVCPNGTVSSCTLSLVEVPDAPESR